MSNTLQIACANLKGVIVNLTVVTDCGPTPDTEEGASIYFFVDLRDVVDNASSGDTLIFAGGGHYPVGIAINCSLNEVAERAKKGSQRVLVCRCGNRPTIMQRF